MPTLAVQLAIGDYAKWRPVFDKHKGTSNNTGFSAISVCAEGAAAARVPR